MNEYERLILLLFWGCFLLTKNIIEALKKVKNRKTIFICMKKTPVTFHWGSEKSIAISFYNCVNLSFFLFFALHALFAVKKCRLRHTLKQVKLLIYSKLVKGRDQN